MADPMPAKEDLTYAGDGALTKQVLKAGDGETPNWGAEVMTECSAVVVVTDKSETMLCLPESFALKPDSGVLPALLIGVPTMRCGEKAFFRCGPQFIHDPSCNLPPMPTTARIHVTISLLSFCNHDPPLEKHITMWTPWEKLRECLREKEAGNALFKSGDYREALTRYYKAKGTLTWTYKFTDAEKSRWNRDVGVPAMLNIAACHLKLEAWQPGIDCCGEILELQPGNVKALFRRGQAYAAQEEYTLALRDLEEAANQDPADAGIQKELSRVKRLDAAALRSQGQKWGKLFASTETRAYLQSKAAS